MAFQIDPGSPPSEHSARGNEHLPVFQENLAEFLNRTNQFAWYCGPYSRRPWMDLMWQLQPGPDPTPFDEEDLARMVGMLDLGGVVVVVGLEQAAVALAATTIEMMAAGGHA